MALACGNGCGGMRETVEDLMFLSCGIFSEEGVPFQVSSYGSGALGHHLPTGDVAVPE